MAVQRAPPSIAVLIGTMVVIPVAALMGLRWLANRSPARAVPVVAARPPIGTTPLGVAPDIDGFILDAAGDPVERSVVRLVAFGPRAEVVAETSSDAMGRFAFGHLDRWPAYVEADHDPEGAVRSVELRSPLTEHGDLTLVLSAAALRGSVVDTDGRSIAGATLSVEGVPWRAPTVVSDAAGAFRFSVAPFEATALLAIAPAYRTSRVALGPREGLPAPFIRVTLEAAPALEGDVLDDRGKPIRARVVACEGQLSEARTTSDEDGTFRLAAEAAGCDAIALHEEFAPSDPVRIVPEQRTVLRLETGGSIEGVVTDPRGSPVPSSIGVESFVGAHGSSARGMGPRHFDAGAFRWDRLAPGTYVLSASSLGQSPGRTDPIDVRAGGVTHVRIVLAVGGIVAGRVYDEGRAPLPGVEIHFDRVSVAFGDGAGVTTDESGAYRIEGAPSGPFTLRLQKRGFRTRMMSGLRVGAGAVFRQDVVLAFDEAGGAFELGGIGASLATTDDGVVLATLFSGDPAERSGLRPGDRVTGIDGEDTAGMSLADVLQRLRGEAGTTVVVSVRRGADTQTVSLVRASIAH